jgi:hypothetical protein
MNNPEYLIYDGEPRYDSWVKWLLFAIIGITLIPGIILIPIDLIGAWTMLSTTAFDGLLLYFIIPRNYQIYSDKIRIVLGKPFAINLPLNTIKEARRASGSKTYLYWGVRLATSSKGVIEFIRTGRVDVVISPADPDTFLFQLNKALKDVSRNK